MKSENQDLTVTILVPELLPEEAHLQQLEEYKSLHRIVSEAQQRRVVSSSLESAVLKWFHGEEMPGENSAANLGYRLDNSKAAVPAGCMRADPVYQQLDINHAILGDRSLIDLTDKESEAIITDLNQHFRDDGVRFESGAEGRWYSIFDQPPAVQTVAPDVATGRNVSLQMPSGDGARRWRGWLSEIEMLLHTHPVNVQRAAAGKTTINSLWLWGEGNPDNLPPISAVHRQIFAENFYTRSLAHYHEAECNGVSQFPNAAAGAELLVVDDRLAAARATGDQPAYEHLLQNLEQQVFVPLDQGLRRGTWQQANLWLGGERWLHVGRRTMVARLVGQFRAMLGRAGWSRG
jgi:hypothetical protein